MLNRFKLTAELDMAVFEPDRILDYADLFISTGEKPSFNKAGGKNNAQEEEGDPFDEMMEEAAENDKAK